MQAHPTRRQAIRVGVMARRGSAPAGLLPCRCRDPGAGHCYRGIKAVAERKAKRRLGRKPCTCCVEPGQ